MTELTHFAADGSAHMVDISGKDSTLRSAIVSGEIKMLASTLQLITEGNHKKGDVLGIARIAGIMASKRCADLIPLCHPIPLSKVTINFELKEQTVLCSVECTTTAATGVEMEALVACQVTLATIYDMCKAVDRGMIIGNIGLQHKSGGKSGVWQRQ